MEALIREIRLIQARQWDYYSGRQPQSVVTIHIASPRAGTVIFGVLVGWGWLSLLVPPVNNSVDATKRLL